MVGTRNYLILFTVGAICLFATIFYYQSNERERIYRQFRGAIKSDIPNLRSRSVTENSSALHDLDIALSREDYLEALGHLESMISTDSNNIALKYYAAILHEQEGNYLKSIDHYQRVRFNSEIFHLEALKRLSLLYIKLHQNGRAIEMLTELRNLGTPVETQWAEDVATALVKQKNQ